MKKKLNEKKEALLDKLLTTKDGKRIKLGKDIKIIIAVVIAIIAVLLCMLFSKLMTNSSSSDSDRADANIFYLDRILLGGKETGETSNIDSQADKQTSKLDEYTLSRVIDGDTIEVQRGTSGTPISVRLLSVNTPESVNPDAALNNEYGNTASEYTKNLLKDTQTVYLSYDTESKDEYGRILAYVWLSKDANLQSEDDIKNYMLNSILVQNGMAEVKIYEPNHKYQEILEKQENEAINNAVGLWSDAGYKQLTKKGTNNLT